GAPSLLGTIPSFPFPEAAASALGRVTQYGEWKRRPVGVIPSFEDVRADEARAIVSQALGRGGGWLTPVEARDLLQSFGVEVVETHLVSTAEEAARVAAEIGFPVVLKAVGPAILHKTEVGGVALSLASEAAVRDVYKDMEARLGDRMTGAAIQRMVPGGVEVVVGATLDPTFGPLVLYGTGGTLVELFNDVSFRISPLSDLDVLEMLAEVKGTALLRGYRGSLPADEIALREIILRVSALLETCPEIQEMDANPIKVLGKGAIVVDARIRVDRQPERPPTRRIAY
ncbi:MAG TPA: acetate--CoA ligase family protein, partial [Blastocatellia bacterium]|nr:acetate--CoA ligase family protein [Blastocatellia bacterium]